MAGINQWYGVGVLTAVSTFAFIDRQILSLLVQPIRRDLGINDTQMSLLLGMSFALPFALAILPMGRLADRCSRKWILGAGLAIWSLCTLACGLARTFVQMILFRIGVGVGEATLHPCAHPMIADSFPPERRGTALGVYAMGIYIGSGLALIAGGAVIRFAAQQQTWSVPLWGEIRSWQLILLVVGLGGLLFSAVLATIPEPPRAARSLSQPAGAVGAFLRTNWRTLLCHNAGFAMFSLATASGGAWIPEMFRRIHHWSIPKFGLYFGIEAAVFGCAGALAAGRLADWLLRRGVRDAGMRVGVGIAALAIPVNAILFLAPSGEWAMFWLAPGAALSAAPFGVAAATLQQILPAAIRGQVTAIYVLLSNLVGGAWGPTLTALLTNRVFQRDDAVNYSLLVVHVVAFTFALILLRTGWKPFLRSLDRLQPPTERAPAARAAS